MKVFQSTLFLLSALLLITCSIDSRNKIVDSADETENLSSEVTDEQEPINVSDLKTRAYYVTSRPLELRTKNGIESFMEPPGEEVLVLNAGAVFFVRGRYSLNNKPVYYIEFRVIQTNATRNINMGWQSRLLFQEDIRNEDLTNATIEEINAFSGQ